MVTGIINTDNYRTEITNGNHVIIADEPEKLGGNNQGMTPTELLASALIGCTNITLRMYANRKEWSVNAVTTAVDYAQDGNDTTFKRTITIDGALDEKQTERMLLIANKCPVHKILSSSSIIKTSINSHG